MKEVVTQSHINGINHRRNLKAFLPRGYRALLAEKYQLSPSMVDNILGGYRKDKKGIIAEAYRIALEENRKNKQVIEEIESLEYLVNKYK